MCAPVGNNGAPGDSKNPLSLIPTGSIQLDIALGIGGIPIGSLVEISGPSLSGKTTLCQHIIAEAQRHGGICAYIDADQTWDAIYASRCGVNLNRLLVCNMNNLEGALECLTILARTGALDVIVLDALTPFNLDARSFPGHATGIRDLSSEQISKTVREISHTIRRNQTVVIITRVSTARQKTVYHALAQHTSRLALSLHAAIRLRLSPSGLIHGPAGVIGQKVRAVVIKNLYNPCQHFAYLDIIYTNGIIKTGEIFDLGIKSSLIEKTSGDYLFSGAVLGPERKEAILTLETNPELANKLEQRLRQRLIKCLSP